MKIVVIESPYRSRSQTLLERNLAYARALVERVTLRGDAPCASHLLITQSLDDRDPAHRKLGIAAGLALLRVADVHAFGIDLGVSEGMEAAMKVAKVGMARYEEISLPEWKAAMDSGDSRLLDDLRWRYQPKWHMDV